MSTGKRETKSSNRSEGERTDTSDSAGGEILSVDGLKKVYGDGDDAVEAVKGIDFEIQSGSVVGILGPNGAGKTTTIKLILGLIFPSDGDIHVGDVDIHEDTAAAHEIMGAMLEGARNTYWRLTVRENLEMFSVIGGRDYRKRTDEIETLIEQFGLEDKADTTVRELSRGQKQKVSLACTLARDTKVIFLDEPTLGLDVGSTRQLQREIRRLAEDDGRTVLLSSHDMDVIQEVCDRVIIMNEGEIVADNTVDNLVDLFDSTIYEIGIEGSLEDGAERRLASEFVLRDVTRQSETTTIEIETDGEFYRVVDQLKELDLDVRSFTEREVDFDDVFLQLTDRDEQNRHRSGTQVTANE